VPRNSNSDDGRDPIAEAPSPAVGGETRRCLDSPFQSEVSVSGGGRLVQLHVLEKGLPAQLCLDLDTLADPAAMVGRISVAPLSPDAAGQG
jgi:hypothetical protein